MLQSPKQYRDDIQGIRAVGAVMIVVYHIWLNKVSGGVDVFFVISGYLMGGKLLRQYLSIGSIDVWSFWGGLARRIAPSAYFVLLVTGLLSVFFVPAVLWSGLIGEIFYSAIHAQNFKLQTLLVDYLARDNPPSPVQQFWALSVQVQFYLLLPLLFFFGAKTRRGNSPLASLRAVVLGVIGLSLVYSVVMTLKAPIPTYFDTFARFWEFLAGVALAMYSGHGSAGRLTRVAAPIAGFSLLTLLLIGLVVPRDVPFPGYIALVPVIAAALLIVTGAHQQTVWHRLLASKPLVFIGSFSFTLYLWHWPVLIFYRYAVPGPMGLFDGLFIIAVSVAMAYATKLLVEDAVLSVRIDKQQRWKPFLVAAAFAAPVLVAALGARQVVRSTTADRQASALHDYRDISGLDNGVFVQSTRLDIPWRIYLTAQHQKTEVLANGCEVKESAAGMKVCVYGDKNATRSMVLTGGSHASQWLPAIDLIGKQRGLKVFSITKTSCPLGYMEWLKNESCRDWNKQIVAKILELAPLAVITNSTRSQRMGESQDVEYVPEEYVDQWLRLSSAKIPVLGIRDNPWFESDPNVCLSLNRLQPDKCFRPKREVLAEINPAEEYERRVEGFHSVDMTDFLCDSDMCFPVFDGNLLYWDRHHVSTTYARQLSTNLLRQFEEALPSAFEPPGSVSTK